MFPRLCSFLTTLTQGERFVHSLDQEVRFHLDAQTDDLIRTGVSPAEAARRAREQFGSVEAMKKECRRARGLWVIDELGLGAAHLGLVLRMFFKIPLVTNGPLRGRRGGYRQLSPTPARSSADHGRGR